MRSDLSLTVFLSVTKGSTSWLSPITSYALFWSVGHRLDCCDCRGIGRMDSSEAATSTSRLFTPNGHTSYGSLKPAASYQSSSRYSGQLNEPYTALSTSWFARFVTAVFGTHLGPRGNGIPGPWSLTYWWRYFQYIRLPAGTISYDTLPFIFKVGALVR